MQHIADYDNWKKLMEAVESQNAVSSILSANKLTSADFITDSSIDTEYWLDLTIDIISALIESIPLAGTGVSATIDILHTISYAARWSLVDDEEAKLKYGILSIIGLGTQFIPVSGNAENILAQMGIKNYLKVSVYKIYPYASKLNTSLGKWAMLNKGSFNFLYVLTRILGERVAEYLPKIVTFFGDAVSKIIKVLKQYANSQTEWIINVIINSLSKMSLLFKDFLMYYPEVTKLALTIK